MKLSEYCYYMREWLRGGAPPCQGGGRGFESRLALFYLCEALILRLLFLLKKEKAEGMVWKEKILDPTSDLF